MQDGKKYSCHLRLKKLLQLLKKQPNNLETCQGKEKKLYFDIVR